MGYVNPFESDEQTIGRDSRLYRKQLRKDFLAAKTEGGIDAAIHASKHTKFTVPFGFKKVPGASRSGALDPQTRARLENDEAAGLIEVARDVYGKVLGYRVIET